MNASQIAEDVSKLASDRAQERPRFGSLDGDAARSLLSPSRLGSFLCNPLLRHPQVRVALEGRAVPTAAYTTTRRIGTGSVTDAIDAREVARWLTRGGTITLDSLEYLSGEVEEVCAAISKEVELQATATAYVTPPGHRGLSPHTDEEDVFVLQTFGTKKWIIDPAQRQEVPTASGFPLNERMLQIEPIVLSPGDMFFMPAGTPHVAEALDSLSIHLTFSVERPRVRDVITQLVATLIEDSPALNRLQSWDAPQTTLPQIVLALGSIASEEHPPSSPIAPRPLPYDSWNSLGNDRLHVELLTEISTCHVDSGYSVQFPDFRIQMGDKAGSVLSALARDGSMELEPHDPEIRELLFHLAGRGTVAITPGTIS